MCENCEPKLRKRGRPVSNTGHPDYLPSTSSYKKERKRWCALPSSSSKVIRWAWCCSLLNKTRSFFSIFTFPRFNRWVCSTMENKFPREIFNIDRASASKSGAVSTISEFPCKRPLHTWPTEKIPHQSHCSEIHEAHLIANFKRRRKCNALKYLAQQDESSFPLKLRKPSVHVRVQLTQNWESK